MEFRLRPLGDNAVIVELGTEINVETQQKIKEITSFFDENNFEWLIEYVPAFTTITLFYDPINLIDVFNKKNKQLPYQLVCEKLETIFTRLQTQQSFQSRVVEIPVCYGGEYGPDLEYVATHNNLTPEEVIAIHSSGDYLVYMIGFAPGFPYIGGMSEKIATPRRSSPRLKIPEGSVGIAGAQTGVYPIETPGGWQLIGKTPLKLFRPKEDSPSLLQAGDKIQFKPITQEDFKEWEAKYD